MSIGTSMSGWETFGTSGDHKAISRPIGHVISRKEAMSAGNKGWIDPDGSDNCIMLGSGGWPDGEVHEGIAYVGLQTHGDDPTGCFLKVCGPDREAVEACWKHIMRNWQTIRGEIWP